MDQWNALAELRNRLSAPEQLDNFTIARERDIPFSFLPSLHPSVSYQHNCTLTWLLYHLSTDSTAICVTVVINRAYDALYFRREFSSSRIFSKLEYDVSRYRVRIYVIMT